MPGYVDSLTDVDGCIVKNIPVSERAIAVAFKTDEHMHFILLNEKKIVVLGSR